MFDSYAIGCCVVGQNRRIVCLERCVEAAKIAAEVGCLVVGLGGYDAFGIGAPWEFNGL